MCQPQTSYCHVPDSAQLYKRDRVLLLLQYRSCGLKKLSKAAVIFIKQALMKMVSHGSENSWSPHDDLQVPKAISKVHSDMDFDAD